MINFVILANEDGDVENKETNVEDHGDDEDESDNETKFPDTQIKIEHFGGTKYVTNLISLIKH